VENRLAFPRKPQKLVLHIYFLFSYPTILAPLDFILGILIESHR
jgi:hypothetical protein